MQRRLERAADTLGFFGFPGFVRCLSFRLLARVQLLARVPVGARRAVRRIVGAIGHGRLRGLLLAGRRLRTRRLLALGLGARRLLALGFGARRFGARTLLVSRALVLARRTIRSPA